MSDTILVTGATGTVGRQVVAALRERGRSVRAGVRRPGAAEDLAALGAEVVRLDFDDAATLGPAFEGVARVFLLTPFVEDFGPLVDAALEAAKAAGARFVVRMSAAGVSTDSPMASARQHARAEAAVAASGLDYTILQPTFFMDNPLKYQSDVIRSTSAFYGASGGQPIAYVSTADIAAVAATVLGAPEAHHAKTYVLTGGEAITDTTLAERIATALGSPVRFVDLELEAYGAGLAEQGAPGWMVDAMVGLESVKRAGWASGVSPDVEALLRRAPETYEVVLARLARA